MQQYKAMFIKRYINFKRFQVGLIWQILFPVVFVIMGLMLAAIINTAYEDDPKRAMTLPLSAPSNNMTLFFGRFIQSPLPFNVEVSITINNISCNYILFSRTSQILYMVVLIYLILLMK